MGYILHLSILICLYTMLAQSLSLSAGRTGLVSLVHAGFYGIGAYTAALLNVKCGLGFWETLPLAILACGLAAALFALAAIRMVEDHFIISTLGFQVIIFSLMNNWTSLTNGPLGISGIAAIPSWWRGEEPLLAALLPTAILTAVVWFLLYRIGRSSFGRKLIAVSEDEIYVQSIGKNVSRLKITAFTLSAVMAAIPGVIYAFYQSYIDPTSFTLDVSVFILCMVIGGGSRLAALCIAAAALVILPELLRLTGIPGSLAANIRQLLYGLVLILAMLYRRKELALFAAD